jgi:hypothetical protein
MPATARRSKSNLYEKGIREGMEMANRARGNKSPKKEEEEMDMGMDPKHSRKRSAKGAKNTKPAKDGMGMKKPMDGGMYGKKPMDGDKGMKKEMEMDMYGKKPMDGAMKKEMDNMCGGKNKRSMDGGMYGKKPMDAECGCKGKKGRKCDGNCGSMRKRSDSLTPQEYLTACEMGIQGRSATYIRARLDTAEARNDLKCGKGAISKGEKCTKGQAIKVEPKKGNKVKAAATIAAIGGAAVGGGYLLGRSGAVPKLRAAVAKGKLEAGLAVSEVKKAGKYGKKMQLKAAGAAVGNIQGRMKLRAAAKKTGAPQAETIMGRVTDPWFSAEGSQLTDRARARRSVSAARQVVRSTRRKRVLGSATQAMRSIRRKRDSMYAAGFAPEPDALAI